MKKKLSAPPLVILLDILFIFLFISFLEQKNFELVFVDGRFPFDIGYANSDNNVTNGVPAPTGLTRLWRCDKFKACEDKSARIFLPEQITDEIFKITAPVLMDNQCNGITIPIKSNNNGNASISYSEILNYNPCMKEQQGVPEWIEKKSHLSG